MTVKLSEGSYHLEGIAFGLADGLIMCLGLTIGVARATSNTQLVKATRSEEKVFEQKKPICET